jgi:hypothetical protein
MENFSQELLFALIFGMVLLVQFLLKHLRKRTRQTKTEVWFEPNNLTKRPNPTEALALPRPVPASPRAAAAPLRHDVRRFSRRSLLGSRRAVQDAIVVAAILGPCRAYQSHETDSAT